MEQERRQYVRIRKNYIIRFAQKGNPSLKFDVSQVENISKGGMCFSSSIAFDSGAEVLIELRTPYIAQTVHLEGKILESTQKVAGLIYHNRLQFSDVSPQALDVLEKIEAYNSKDKIS
ncbi:MAG: PilZ domain-containing protein [Elusimicrobia bacterium]|nr:PilZ domain-containing protein [Elusimicrobiota bacterium]